MPISRKEVFAELFGGTGSGGGNTTTPATADVQTADTVQLAGGSNTTIPSGAYKVEVYNTGFDDITVNGKPIKSNDHAPFEAVYNPVTNRMDFTPDVVVVVPAGGKAYYVENRPST